MEKIVFDIDIKIKFAGPLTELLREEARKSIAQAVEVELNEYLSKYEVQRMRSGVKSFEAVINSTSSNECVLCARLGPTNIGLKRGELGRSSAGFASADTEHDQIQFSLSRSRATGAILTLTMSQMATLGGKDML